MKWGALTVTHCSAGIAGFVCGWLVCDVPGITVDHEIDPVAVVALCLSAIISVWLYRRLEKGKYSDQLAKDAVLRTLGECLDALGALEAACQESPACEFTRIVKASRRCRIEFDRYVKYSTALAFAPADSQVLAYKSVCFELHDMLTNTPTHDDAPDEPLKVQAGRLIISKNRLVEVERKVDAARTLLHDLQKGIILSV
jgi:hypothetical protein